MKRTPDEIQKQAGSTSTPTPQNPPPLSGFRHTTKQGRNAPIDSTVAPPGDRSRLLWGYVLLTYAVLLVNTAGYLGHVPYRGIGASIFLAAVYATYTFFYLVPILVILLMLHFAGRLRFMGRFTRGSSSPGRWIFYGIMILGCTIVQYLIFADKTVFRIFGFHLNGFVWNLVCTKGGIESMGGGTMTTVFAVLVGLLFLAVQVGLLFLMLKTQRVRTVLNALSTRRRVVTGLSLVLVIAGTAQITYGVSSFQDYGPILTASDTFPCFLPTTFNSLAKSMGFKVHRDLQVAMNVDSTRLQYPLQTIRRDESVKPLNIVWLVSESLRADMLDPDIMPQTWALSEKSSRFEHHYSGGNGTRMGMFSMFYGLYGPYWFSFLAENRGPVLIDTLIDLNYQMSMYTGAKFSYPEFDKTIFSKLRSDQLHEGGGKPSWRQDQRHITSMLHFIEQRDPARPFMTFMFFESPHANYSFSKQCIIRRPYAKGINYLTMDLDRDIKLIKNRYINACNQVDRQVERIVDYLTSHGILNSTIVLLTGDHGEEFMEKGYWGHNSKFTEEQTLVPFVLWVPGKPARTVTRITSHLDIPATLMSLLGVLNPAEDYSQGVDLFGSKAHDFVVISDWNHMTYVGPDFKAVFSTSAFTGFRRKVTTAADVPVESSTFYQQHRDRIVKLMRGLKSFHP